MVTGGPPDSSDQTEQPAILGSSILRQACLRFLSHSSGDRVVFVSGICEPIICQVVQWHHAVRLAWPFCAFAYGWYAEVSLGDTLINQNPFNHDQFNPKLSPSLFATYLYIESIIFVPFTKLMLAETLSILGAMSTK